MERWGRLDEEKIKLSQTLANKSTTYLDQDLDVALLVSLAALRQANTVAARASLLDALEHNPPLEKFLSGHHGALRSVAFSPDGSVLASGGCAFSGLEKACAEGELRLWNFPSGEMRPSLEGPIAGEVRALAFTPDGNRIAAGGTGDKVFFWDLRTHARAPSVDNVRGTYQFHCVFADGSGLRPRTKTLQSSCGTAWAPT